MSALVALFGDPSPTASSLASRMLAGCASRGADALDVQSVDGATLGVSRHAWECAAYVAGPATVVREGELAVIADAAIYYRSDLVRALAAAGVRASGDSPAHCIAAAYRAWGDACAEHLEGDFAFVVWDGARGRALAARDPVGSRSLYHAVVGDRLLVASAIGGLLAHPDVSAELNLVALAETAAVMFAGSHETVYRAVSRLGVGERLTWSAGSGPRTERYWNAPRFAGEEAPAVPMAEAAEELQRLIVAAAAERIAPSGLTAVFMSGGADSPAVFAAAQAALREQGDGGRRVEPVSVSFPVGDSGREDEYIAAIAARWNVPVNWVDIADAPMLAEIAERAANRDEPFGHPFETFNRLMARRAAERGSRIALNGFMGDTLFQQSGVYLADLVRRGRWVHAVREWRAAGGSGARELFRWAVQPLLPARAASGVSRILRGVPLTGHLDRPMAPWIEPGFARRHDLEGRERRFRPAHARESLSSYEARWQLVYPFFPRIYGAVVDVQREEGIEARAPLADGRVIRFAATRPRVERNRRGDTKLLLRMAMRGLLPDEVLATRQGKTGTLSSYFASSVRRSYDAVFDHAFTGSVLAELGIVDERVLRERARQAAANMANQDGPWLMFTLLTELWLRAKTRGGAK